MKYTSTAPRDTLLIGFAYSLTSDGAPGTYNRALAQSIKNDIDGGIQNAWIGMQWEIYDALEQLYRECGTALPTDLVPLSLVATPPPFAPNDILDKNRFIAFMAQDERRVHNLRQHLDQLLGEMGHSSLDSINAPDDKILKEMLAAFLNSLLHDPLFFRSFDNTVELQALVKESETRDWREERVMPKAVDYPSGLHRLQSQRVNRLIIEAIIPNDILERGGYLSTRGVLDQIIPEIGRAGRAISSVRVYGHPAHRPRCRRQFLEYVWNQGWPATPDQVAFGHMREFWDPETAQHWCRSREDWDTYERDPGRLK